jgi:glycosyltransferase involved in cell wall biosynthesis
MPTAAPLLAEGGAAPAGGAENQVLMLARELARRGHSVGIVAFGGGAPLRGRVDGVDVIELTPPHTRVPVVRTLAFWAKTFRVLRATPTRVIVQRAAGIHTALAAAAARLLRTRFVFASAGLHDFDFGSWEPKRWIVSLYGRAVRMADQVVVQSEEQAALCRRRFGREPVVIASIAEPAPRQAGTPGAFLWVGRLDEHKRPEAYLELARALPEARFRMVAVAGEVDGADIPNLELLAPRPRAGLAPLFDDAVAIVSTSRSEGMPNVFLEGWARGVPALALAHDPDGAIEREGLGGFAGGSPERLAELARELWESRGDRAELAARCRDHVARAHAVGPVADRWCETLGLGRCAE